MAEELKCPLLMLGWYSCPHDNESDCRCFGDDCAWFVYGKCAIARLADESARRDREIDNYENSH